MAIYLKLPAMRRTAPPGRLGDNLYLTLQCPGDQIHDVNVRRVEDIEEVLVELSAAPALAVVQQRGNGRERHHPLDVARSAKPGVKRKRTDQNQRKHLQQTVPA